MRFLLIKSHYLALLRLFLYGWLQLAEIIKCIFSVKDIGIPDLGNTVQNARSNLNTSFNMDMLYKYLGWLKIRINRQIDRERQRQNQVKSGQYQCKTTSAEQWIYWWLNGVLTSVKNIQVNYTENSGTVLPGYTPVLDS
jgi:cell surface protein SprA